MIVLQTLGATAIRVGTHRVLPGAARAFGTLLYLTMERGRSIPRGELQRVLFEGRKDPTVGHGLRQILYRLRRIGTPIEAHGDVVILPATAVEADYSAVAEADRVDPAAVKAAAGGVLPGYAPEFSKPFERWIEERRSSIERTVLGRFVEKLAEVRAAGRWRDLEPLAKACLALDPLNEEATLALAEGLALSGQKAGAVQLLDRYLEEVTPFGKELRLPASLLRRRISEHVPEQSYGRLNPGPFVGRDAEMAELWRHYRAAKQGEPRGVVIYGEPGIGKTRLATEFLRAAGLEGATCIKVECAAYDARRPLGLFVDLVPKLFEAPGGLGVSPEAIVYLKRLTELPGPEPSDLTIAEPKTLSTAIARAIIELFESVASEQPIIALIDNAHFADVLSRDLLSGLLAKGAGRRWLALLTTRTPAALLATGSTVHEQHSLHLHPLADPSAEALLESLGRARREPLTSSTRRDLIRLAVGNPLYLETALGDLHRHHGDVFAPTSLRALIRERVNDLEQEWLHALAAHAIAGRRFSVGLLEEMTGLSRNQLLVAIQSLHDRGFLHASESQDGRLHPLVEEAVLDRVGPSVRRLLHHRAAVVLSHRTPESKDAGTLWDCALHWEQAGEPARGIDLLRSYAAYCMKIGQPSIACDLLRRASNIAAPAEARSLVQGAMNAAYVAEDYRTVRALYRDQRALSPSAVPHDEFELLDIQAARRDGASLADHADQLWDCLSSNQASLSHRLRAAGTFVVYADGWFERSRASRAYQLLRTIAATDKSCEPLWANVDILYQVHFGDPSLAVQSASRALALAANDPDPWQALTLGINSSIAYYIGGLFQQAINSLHFVHERAIAAGSRRTAAQAASLMASVHIDYGYIDKARYWDGVADNAIAAIGSPDGVFSHLSNKIELALIDGDFKGARSWLKSARAGFAELAAPHNACIDKGYDLLISLYEGDVASWYKRVDELQADHALARYSWSHDAFVEGFARLLHSGGQIRQAVELITRHVNTDRRERSPLRRTLAEFAESIGCRIRPYGAMPLAPSVTHSP